MKFKHILIRKMRQKDRRPEEPFLTFVCRIRRPLPLELGDVRPTPRLKSKTPKGVIADCDYSVFTTIKESGIVLSSDTPITGRLINASLSTAGDAPAFVRGLDQKAILTHTFDHAISDTVTQEEFFTRHARRLVQTGFQGRSGTILAYGPAGYAPTLRCRQRGQDAHCTWPARFGAGLRPEGRSGAVLSH